MTKPKAKYDLQSSERGGKSKNSPKINLKMVIICETKVLNDSFIT